MYCVVRSDTYAFRTAPFAFRGERDIAEKGQAYKIGGGAIMKLDHTLMLF